MIKQIYSSLVIVCALGAATQASACASCGSGGEDPMILYPWEQWKAYIGIARTGDIESLDQNGQAVPAYQVTTRNTTTVSMGHSFSQRFFMTGTGNYIVNRRDDYDRSSWGDPLLAARYTALQQTMANDWIPQVQLLASYKTGQATSKYDQIDPAGLDIFGNGLPEGRAGIDIWHGMNNWKGGVAQTVTMPIGVRDTDFGKVEPGVTYRSTLSLGHSVGENAKVVGGINREQTTKLKIDGAPQDSSDTLSYGFFAYADATVERSSNIRFTWSKTSAFATSRNGTRSQTFAMAVMRSF